MTFDPDSGCGHESRERRPPVPKRGPAGDVEVWAAATLMTVAGMDPDGAAARNGVGFDKFDSEFGASLAGQFAARGELSDKQWTITLRLARKYRGQVATAEPVPTPPSPAEASATRIRELKALLAAAQARITAIETDAVPATDPAHGSRCYRGHAPEDGRAYVCPGCSYRIGGESTQHRNAVCRGIEFMCQTQAEIAELEGRGEDAKALRGFVKAVSLEACAS